MSPIQFYYKKSNIFFFLLGFTLISKMLTAKRDVGPLEENVDLHHAFYGTTVSSLRNPPIMKSTFYKWRVFQDKKLKGL